MRWRLLLSPPRPGADNMALDEALMARARRTGESVLRVYEWSAPTLSFGRNQRATGLYDIRAVERAGIAVVRRLTGGRALLHSREVTYCVTAPAAPNESIRESYAWINRLLVDGLARLGVDARLADAEARAMAPDATPCFETPASGELVVDGRKLVGSAQWWNAGAMLQHGSILVDDDQPLANSLLVAPPIAVPRPATLRAILGRAPDATEVMKALEAALRAHHHGSIEALEVDEVLADEAGRARGRYIDDAWTWRR